MTSLEHLQKLFSEGKISRRQFLAKATALGLSVAVAPSLFPKKAAAATPKKGGFFKQAITGGSTSDTLDPATHTSSWNINCELQIRNTLTEIDHKFTPVPSLAESWESSPDAKKWIFNLRKGVEFHDGKSLDAEDVIYTMNHHRGEESKSAAKPYLEPVTDIKADGKNRVIFELDTGVADFPFIMSDYHLAVFKAGTKGKEGGRRPTLQGSDGRPRGPDHCPGRRAHGRQPARRGSIAAHALSDPGAQGQEIRAEGRGVGKPHRSPERAMIAQECGQARARGSGDRCGLAAGYDIHVMVVPPVAQRAAHRSHFGEW